MDESGAKVVMENRLSWNTFNKIRMTEGLVTKRKCLDNSETLPLTKKKYHGCKPENLTINTNELLEEARKWAPQEHVNWSQLATRYGLLTTPNRGQVIKEILKEETIPTAFCVQEVSNTPRRPKKKFQSSRISFPMHKPVHIKSRKFKRKFKR